ncbi:MAG: class F sortase [Ornithinibacter sp.]
MSSSTRFGDRRGAIAAAVTVVLLLLGGGFVARALTTPGPPPQPDTSQAQVAAPAPSPSQPDASPDAATPSPPASAPAVAPASDFGPILGPSAPVALRIPSIKVTTKGLVDLGLDSKGQLEAPKKAQQAGWYSGGPTPGEFGPSVIAAHVDSHLGPALFYRLGAVKKGAKVMVDRADGTTATFVIDHVERYPKAEFPTSTVYADTGGRAELRLITCGGDLDSKTGHYVDNIVAYAHLIA